MTWPSYFLSCQPRLDSHISCLVSYDLTLLFLVTEDCTGAETMSALSGCSLSMASAYIWILLIYGLGLSMASDHLWLRSNNGLGLALAICLSMASNYLWFFSLSMTSAYLWLLPVYGLGLSRTSAYIWVWPIYVFNLSLASLYLYFQPIYGFALSMAYPIYGFGLSMASAYIWLLSIYYKYGQVYLLCSILLVEHWYDRFIWPQPIYGLRLYMALSYLWLQPSFGFCLSMAWAYLRLWPIYSFSHQWLRLDLVNISCPTVHLTHVSAWPF